MSEWFHVEQKAVAKRAKGRPYAILVYEGKVPAFKDCKVCEGRGKFQHDDWQTYSDGRFICHANFGHVRLCSRCNGCGALTVYLTRGQCLTPIVARSIGIWERFTSLLKTSDEKVKV